MTEREYEQVLDAVHCVLNPQDCTAVCRNPGEAPPAANDNAVEWPLTPFPAGWQASP